MATTPQTFIATTVGRVAIPKLADTLVRTGADKFVKLYGQKAFEVILGTAVGARAYSKTEEYITEYLNHIDTGGDEGSFVPKGSMPTATRAEQMDAVMAVPNTTAFANNNNEDKEEETTGTELSTEVKEEPPKLPEEPPKGPDIGTELATEAVTQATKKILEDKKPDVSKQTEDLIKKQKTKFRKHQSGQYFVDINGKEKFEIFNKSTDTGEKLASWQVSGQDEFGDNQGFIEVINTFNTYREAKEYVLQLIEEQTKKVPEKEDTTPGIGHNQPPSAIEEAEIKEKDKSGVVVPTSLTTENFLQPKLLNDMLKLQGGLEGHKKLFEKNPKTGFSAAPMPASTKKKMYHQLSEIIDNKYNLSRFPEGESQETVTEERLEYLQNTSSKRFEAIDYIVSAAYDVINGPTKGYNLSDTIFVTDNEGLPMAAAKIELKFSGPKVYSRDALTITEAGSIFRNAGDQLFDAIIKRAKDEGKRFIVAEDLTSSEALEAMKRRGFKPPTTKALKPFKGRKVNRPNGRVAYQKNLVLDLSKEIIKEQTDNLLKKK